MEPHDHNTIAKLEKLRHIKLSEAKRTQVWKQLAEYADFHTMPVPAVKHRASWWQGGYLRIAGAALAGVLVVSGGTAAAAQGTLPGDMLYGVKLGFNERVRTAVTFGAKNNAELAATFLEERIEEAQKLVQAGELPGPLEQSVSTRIESYAEAADGLAAQTEAATTLSLRSRIDSLLESTSRLALNVSPTLARRPSPPSRTIATAESGSSASAALDARMGMGGDHQMGFGSAEMGMGSAESSATLQAPIADVDLNQFERQLSALADVIKENAPEINPKLQLELNKNLNTAAQLLADAKTAPDRQAENAARTADLLLKIESQLAAIAELEFSESTGLIIDLHFGEKPTNSSISSFAECIAAGYPVMESYPEQCRAGGIVFPNPLQGALEPPPETGLESDPSFQVEVEPLPLEISL